ncbi:hypothetical protein L210DRAFT_3630038 [Boletus edulis BED1]|uniref:C2H2-type domain-containing protein n=1 Tax=Boletus edulis BED1 TaxID=1328754 RepID=A0AAD4BVN3_BOLED|nr:hypothetical protein L210DRAFT_3630038 [Boletus edulis BED1]
MWSPSPVIVSPYSPSGPHISDVRSYGSLPLLAGGSKDFMNAFPSYRTMSRDVALNPQAMVHTQEEQGLIPGFSTSMEYHPTSATTNLDHAAFPKNSLQVSPPSSGSIDDREDFGNDEVQPPVMLYHTPRKNGPHRRRCQRRACAIGIEGLWIDEDDLYSGAGQGNGMINVHECQWAKYSNPCGMWIIGSRPRVGTHIRKWHPQSHVHSMAKCQWNGCTASKAMLKDSINRHVVTVHLSEGFHCHGCNQELSRKDVYDQHVRNGLCRNAEATIVYGREHKVIDTKIALRRGGPVRHAD